MEGMFDEDWPAPAADAPQPTTGTSEQQIAPLADGNKPLSDLAQITHATKASKDSVLPTSDMIDDKIIDDKITEQDTEFVTRTSFLAWSYSCLLGLTATTRLCRKFFQGYSFTLAPALPETKRLELQKSIEDRGGKIVKELPGNSCLSWSESPFVSQRQPFASPTAPVVHRHLCR
jgi:hypothetical protein